MNVPTVSDFKAFFVRDFQYSADQIDNTKVLDADITKAIQEAGFFINEAIFETQADYTLGYLYITAHYLCTDLQNSTQGLNGTYTWLVQSKSVGQVSESYQIPEFIMKNPALAYLSKTTYGAKYLSLVVPKLVGGFGIAGGATLA